MLRLVVFVALGLGTIVGVPAVRARVMPPLEPVLEKLGLERKLADPIKRRKADAEIRVVLHKLTEAIQKKQEVPDPLGFQYWLKSHTRFEKRGMDPWGRPYYLSDANNQLTVGSNGPDRKRETADDVRITLPFH
jgi:hypothetical protein